MVRTNSAAASLDRNGSSAPANFALTPAYAAAQALLRGEPLAKRPTPADAFRIAREMFVHGQRVDMGALAKKVGVSRGTLYRWTGNRERLLTDILWASHEEIAHWCSGKNEVKGKELIARRIEAYMHVVATARPLRQLLEREPEMAFRILTRRGTGFGNHERAVVELVKLIEREQRNRNYKPRLDPATLAYAITRIIEGFIYNDIIARIEPDLKGASKVIRALL